MEAGLCAGVEDFQPSEDRIERTVHRPSFWEDPASSVLSPSAVGPEQCPDTFPKRLLQCCLLGPHSDPAKLSSRFQFLLPPCSPPLTLWLTDRSSVFPSPDTFHADLLPAFHHHSGPRGLLSIALLSEAFTD